MRTRSKRPTRLGTVGETTQVFLAINVKDIAGNPVRNKTFWVDRVRAENGSKIPEYSGKYDTDENGNIVNTFPWDGDPTVSALISVTPLFGSEDAPNGKAIVWRVPAAWRDSSQQLTPIQLILKPGGGMESGASVVAPVPVPQKTPAPVPPSSVPGNPGKAAEIPGGMTAGEIAGWVALGLGALAFTYFFVLPAIFGKDDE